MNELVMAIAKNDGLDGNIAYGDRWSLNKCTEKAEKLLAVLDGDIVKALAVVKIL